jgi:hypothetical protein
MKKILIAMVGSMFLFVYSNSLAFDCETGCEGLMPNSKWCKCATECNSNNLDCVESGIGCIEGWGGVYFEYNECMKDVQPFDTLWCNGGNTCPQAVCKGWMQYYGWVEYKNIGQCIRDQAAKYGYVEPGFWDDDEYYWCDSDEGKDVTWIEACECVKASGCDATNEPTQ